MMSNLFSVFDPSTSTNLPLNWTSTLLGLLFIPTSMWLIPSRHLTMWNLILSKLHNEFSNLLSKSKGSTFIFMSTH